MQWDSRCYGNKDDHKQHDTMWNKYQNAIGFVVTTEPAVAKCKRMLDEAAETNLRQADMIARGFPFKRDRDVSLTTFPLVLDPTGGPYVVLPMTFEPRVDGKYYLTVKSNKPVKIEQVSISADVLPTEGEEDEEEDEEEEEEEEDEAMKLPAESELEFPEEELSLRLSQENVVALCRKKQVCEPWVRQDPEFGFRFEDAEFKAEERNLVLDVKNPGPALQLESLLPSEVVWLRPEKIDFQIKDARGPPPKPRLFKDEKRVNGGIVQGALTDCWLLGALGMLAAQPDLLRALFVDYSSACDEFGIYTLRFYKDGGWKTVTVDNRLPCTPKGQLLLSRGADPTELWVPIVEKAYAKLHGCYELLGAGTVAYALKDLTGGAAQLLQFGQADVESRIRNGMLWKEMTLLLKSGSLLGAAIRHDKARRNENLGIESGHCYSVVAVKELDLVALGQKMYEKETVLRLVQVGACARHLRVIASSLRVICVRPSRCGVCVWTWACCACWPAASGLPSSALGSVVALMLDLAWGVDRLTCLAACNMPA